MLRVRIFLSSDSDFSRKNTQETYIYMSKQKISPSDLKVHSPFKNTIKKVFKFCKNTKMQKNPARAGTRTRSLWVPCPSHYHFAIEALWSSWMLTNYISVDFFYTFVLLCPFLIKYEKNRLIYSCLTFITIKEPR